MVIKINLTVWQIFVNIFCKNIKLSHSSQWYCLKHGFTE